MGPRLLNVRAIIYERLQVDKPVPLIYDSLHKRSVLRNDPTTFLLSAAAKSLSLASIFTMKDADAAEMALRRIRWTDPTQ